MDFNFPLTIHHIESTAIRCTNEILNDTITQDQLYKGVTKVKSSVSLARRMVFLFMHDHYGLSYRYIAIRAGFTTNAVIHAVMKARVLRFIDTAYRNTYNLIDKRL